MGYQTNDIICFTNDDFACLLVGRVLEVAQITYRVQTLHYGWIVVYRENIKGKATDSDAQWFIIQELKEELSEI